MEGGHTEVVKFLLSKGAKVSAYLGPYYSIILQNCFPEWFMSMYGSVSFPMIYVSEASSYMPW